MNDEETKAIETLADLKERKFYTHAFDNGTLILDDDEIESIDIVLNLIEKQSKVIRKMAKMIIFMGTNQNYTEEELIKDIFNDIENGKYELYEGDKDE